MTDVLDRVGIYSITHYDEQRRLTLCMATLADVFRRAGAEGVEARDRGLAALFNQQARQLSAALAEFEEDGKYNPEIARLVVKIAILARDNEIERVILPIDHSRKAGAYLLKNILYGENFSKHYNIRVDLREGAYESAPAVGALGEPREGARSAFDFRLF